MTKTSVKLALGTVELEPSNMSEKLFDDGVIGSDKNVERKKDFVVTYQLYLIYIFSLVTKS